MRIERMIGIAVVLMVLGAVTSFAANDSVSHDVTINVVEVAMIDLNDPSTIVLNTGNPGAAGGDPTGGSDTSKTVQYTSITDGVTTRAITANLGGGDTTPAGTSLTLSAVGGTGTQTVVDGPAVNIITGIGSTATGATGPVLTYAIAIGTVSSLNVGDSSTVTVTLTLTDY